VLRALFIHLLTGHLRLGVIAGLMLCLSLPVKAEGLQTHFELAAHEWPPFSSRQTRFFGVVPRITSELMHAQGIEVKYRFMHWSDTLDGIVTEEFDGALVWVMEDLRHEAFLVSEPILRYRSALYFRKDFPRPTSINDLLGFRMGVNPRYVYDKKSYSLLKSGRIEPIQGEDDLTNFRHLVDGRIDYYLSPLLTSKLIIENNFTSAEQANLSYTSSIFKFPSTHLIVNRHREGSFEFMRNFNSGLQRLRTNGTVDRYLEDFRFSKY